MTPTKTYLIPTSMTTRTVRTLHRVGQLHRPATILFGDQNRCGSNMEQEEHKIETVDELQHLGTFEMKPLYQFGMHKDDPVATEYNKLDPQVLVIASSAMAGQRRGPQFLSSRHAAVVSKTNATIYKLRGVVDMNRWRKTAPFPYETMQSASDTFFDENRTPGSAPS